MCAINNLHDLILQHRLMADIQSCFALDDEFDDVVHKSDEEEDDILSAVAAMKQRDADVQSRLPEASRAEPEEEAVGPSWSDLEASSSHLSFLSCSLPLEVVKSVLPSSIFGMRLHSAP